MSRNNLPTMCNEDIVVEGNIYRFHHVHEEYIIKIRTYGADGTSYAGWSFVSKFKEHDKDRALEEWRLLYNRRDQKSEAVSTGSAMVIKPKAEVPATSDAELQKCAEQINADFGIYKKHEQEATKYMLKVGLMLEYVKTHLPHGQLNRWIEANLNIGYRHASRFRKLAQVFIKANQLDEVEAFALVNPENSKKALLKKLEQMAFDFLGDKAQAELFAEYGIQVREPKKLGGLRIPKPKPIPEGETQDHYEAIMQIGGFLDELDRCFFKPTRPIIHLNVRELKNLEGELVSALENVRTLIKAG